MGWGTNINRSGKGIIWSTDCSHGTGSEGVPFGSIQEVLGLIQGIDQALRLHGREAPDCREADRIQVQPCQQAAGKWEIRRAEGNWVRLERDEIWGLRNELLHKLAP